MHLATGSLADLQQVAGAIERYRVELKEAAGENLISLFVYGGVARGRYRAGRSDVNLGIVLREAGTKQLGKLAPTLQAGWREIRLDPFIVLRDEIQSAAEAFPTKLADMAAHHLMLHGEDVLSSVRVTKRDVCRRVEQELRNLALRLRRRFVSLAGDEAGLRQVLLDAVVPLRINLKAMLELAGEKPPEEDRSALVFEVAARRFSLDSKALAQLSELRNPEQKGGGTTDLAAAYDAVMTAVQRSADIVGAMGGESDEPA